MTDAFCHNVVRSEGSTVVIRCVASIQRCIGIEGALRSNASGQSRLECSWIPTTPERRSSRSVDDMKHF